MTKRLEYIDAMRGFTMILVVLSHIIAYGYGIVGDEAQGFVTFNQLFVRFRMPLFFFVSGFVLYKPDALLTWRDKGTFLRKKFMVQIIPTAIFMGLFCFLFQGNFVADLYSPMKAGYWFTIALFEYFCIYLAVRSVVRGQRWFGPVLLCTALAVYALSMANQYYESTHEPNAIAGLLGVRQLKYVVFFATGVEVKRNYATICRWMDNQYITALAVVAFVLSFFVASSFFPPRLYGIASFLPEGLLGVFIVLAFFRRGEASFTQDKAIGRGLQYIGRRTLDVYLLHYFFLPRNLQELGAWFDGHSNPTLEFCCSLLLSLAVIGVCLAVSRVIRTSPFLAHYLFGVKRD